MRRFHRPVLATIVSAAAILVPHAAQAAPSNDKPAGATAMSGLPYRVIEDTRTATDDPGVIGCRGTQASVYFRYHADHDGAVTFDTAGSDYDTALSLYDSPIAGTYPLACNDDTSTSLQAQLTMYVTAGESILVMVSQFPDSGHGGSLHLSATEAPEPSVTATVADGKAITAVGVAAVPVKLTCNVDMSGHVDLAVHEPTSQGDVFGIGTATFTCTPGRTTIAKVYVPSDKPFVPGFASVTPTGEACSTTTCRQIVQLAVTIRLKAQ